jgi:type IV secretory pathway VirD2 relaxase
MKQPLEKLEQLLRGPVRWRKSDSGSPWHKKRKSSLAENLQKVARITRGAPEVMVRISGKAKGARHVEEHLRYITRQGELIAEDESGQLVIGRRMVMETATAWMEGSALNRRRNSRDTVNIVLSMRAGTDREKLHQAARLFGQRTFAGHYSYLMVRHDDTDHPHCHLTVRSLGFDGHRLNPRRDDLQAWREIFAEACREMGIAAEATPRRARGVVKKPQKQAIRHADRDEKTGPRSTVQKNKAREAVAAVLRPGDGQSGPWDRAIKLRRQEICETWNDAAKALEGIATESAVALATQIREFVRQMPAIETERQELQRKVREQLQQRSKQSDRSDDPERSI